MNVNEQQTNGVTPYLKIPREPFCRPQWQTGKILFHRTIKHNYSENKHHKTKQETQDKFIDEPRNLKEAQKMNILANLYKGSKIKVKDIYK